MKDNRTLLPPGSDLLFGKTYITRYASYVIKNRFAHQPDEYRLFPCRQTVRTNHAIELPLGCNDEYQCEKISFYDSGAQREENLDSFINRTDTTAFLVMKDGKLIVEKYSNGFKRDSIFRIYSITKSVVSALTGIALHSGLIGSVNDKITQYLPELRNTGYAEDITIRHLLLMNWGIRQKDGYAPWKGEAKTYLKRDIRKFILKCRIDKPDGRFHYNDYHPLLLGLILERLSGMTQTEYLYNNLWKHLGCEFEANFSCDSPGSMFEKSESGLNIRAVDLMRFGHLFLNGGGNANGKQIIPAEWIKESTSPLDDNITNRYSHYDNHPWGRMVFNKPQNYYKYFWWGSKLKEENYYDYYALGVLGQVLYISPKHNAVAIRLGNSWTVRDWWPRVLQAYISNLSN